MTHAPVLVVDQGKVHLAFVFVCVHDSEFDVFNVGVVHDGGSSVEHGVFYHMLFDLERDYRLLGLVSCQVLIVRTPGLGESE